MTIDLSLGFSVFVYADGSFELPNRIYTTADLKKIAREVNRALRESMYEQEVKEMCDE